MMKKYVKSKENGSVILWTMMFMSLFLLTISAVAIVTIAEIRQATKINSSTEAYLLAEAGSERAKNYANKDRTGSKTAKMNGNEYSFQVAKSPAGTSAGQYDTPPRPCDNSTGETVKYCYFSQASVGQIRRKIDGFKANNDPRHSKGVNLLANDFPAWNYMKTASGNPINASMIWVNGAPFHGANFETITADAKYFRVKGTVSFREAGKLAAGDYQLGLTDGGAILTMQVKSTSVTLIGNVGTVTPIDITDMNEFRYELVYQKGGSSPVVILKVSEVYSSSNPYPKCRGVITTFAFPYLLNIGNAHLFFSDRDPYTPNTHNTDPNGGDSGLPSAGGFVWWKGEMAGGVYEGHLSIFSSDADLSAASPNRRYVDVKDLSIEWK